MVEQFLRKNDLIIRVFDTLKRHIALKDVGFFKKKSCLLLCKTNNHNSIIIVSVDMSDIGLQMLVLQYNYGSTTVLLW